jgi:predicted kinase
MPYRLIVRRIVLERIDFLTISIRPARAGSVNEEIPQFSNSGIGESMRPIVLIVGAPASGKSTASRALAATFPKSIAICVDDLRSMVVSGVVHPGAVWSDELAHQLRLARTSAVEMVKIYHAAGFAVIIDDFWDPNTQMSEYQELFDNPVTIRVLLYPEPQKAHAQNLSRSGPGRLQEYLDEGIRIVYADLRKIVDGLEAGGWVILDTTNDSVDDTVARLKALP